MSHRRSPRTPSIAWSRKAWDACPAPALLQSFYQKTPRLLQSISRPGQPGLVARPARASATAPNGNPRQPAVLALAGRLDGLASPALEQRVDAALASGAKTLVLDLSALAYVSSAGLRVFLGAAKKFKTAGGRATFVALPAPVREVFELSGFLGVLDVRADLASAL